LEDVIGNAEAEPNIWLQIYFLRRPLKMMINVCNLVINTSVDFYATKFWKSKFYPKIKNLTKQKARRMIKTLLIHYIPNTTKINFPF
jgi:hypothetical protein